MITAVVVKGPPLGEEARMNKAVMLIGILIGVLVAIPIFALGTTERILAPLIEWALPDAVIRMPIKGQEKIVILTIDDAPSAQTGAVLDILARHGVRTTFFVHTSQIRDDQTRQAMERMATEGHDIANHMPEDRSYRGFPEAAFAEEFRYADSILRQYEAAYRPYFRPPQGAYSPQRMDRPLIEHGYDHPIGPSKRRYIMASFIPWDAAKGKTDTDDRVKNQKRSDRYTDQLLANLYPGAIVIFHDGMPEGREMRIEATLVSLDRFITEAKAIGYSIVPLSAAQ